MSKFTEYLEGTKETSKTNLNEKYLNDLKSLLGKEDKKYLTEYFKKNKTIPNGLQLPRDNQNLPRLTLFTDMKNEIIEKINASSFQLESKKDLEELIQLLKIVYNTGILK